MVWNWGQVTCGVCLPEAHPVCTYSVQSWWLPGVLHTNNSAKCALEKVLEFANELVGRATFFILLWGSWMEIVNYVLRLGCLSKCIFLHLPWYLKINMHPIRWRFGGGHVRAVTLRVMCIKLSFMWVSFFFFFFLQISGSKFLLVPQIGKSSNESMSSFASSVAANNYWP
jgi:hypothetical protein